MLFSLLVLASVVSLIQSYSLRACPTQKVSLDHHVLSARTHKNYLYGDAIDSLKRRNPYKKQLDEKLDKMGIDNDDLDSHQDGLKSGEDLRRARNKDLREVHATQMPNINYRTREEKERNWSENEIISAMECLNMATLRAPDDLEDSLDAMYDDNSIEEKEEKEENKAYDLDFSDLMEGYENGDDIEEEEYGSIDWKAFKTIASEKMEGYADNERIQHNVQSWIEFHIRKTDIRFEDNIYIWDPAGAYRRGKDKMRARHRSGDKNRPPGSKARRMRKFSMRVSKRRKSPIQG